MDILKDSSTIIFIVIKFISSIKMFRTFLCIIAFIYFRNWNCLDVGLLICCFH